MTAGVNQSLVGQHIRQLEEVTSSLRRCQEALHLASSCQSTLVRAHTTIGASIAFHDSCGDFGNPTLERMLGEAVEAANVLSSSLKIYTKIVEAAEEAVETYETSVVPGSYSQSFRKLEDLVHAFQYERKEHERRNAAYMEQLRQSQAAANYQGPFTPG